ncbi:MAG: radical SAM protein [Candidatus Omnitrophota bacterium]
MKYIYGPVKSRRLGYSLGISTVVYKVCSFNCVYCQLRETSQKTLRRRKYVPVEDILGELRSFFGHKPRGLKVDCVTFSGSGEPTLHQDIGVLIRSVKALTKRPVVLITNSSTLAHVMVRREILAADIVVPSLDAVTQGVFEKIDRPVRGLKIKNIIDALKKFRKEFKGQIWLEIMLVRGVNDSSVYLQKMKRVVDAIGPDRVQLNSPVRPPAESWAKPVTAKTLCAAKALFGKHCDVI